MGFDTDIDAVSVGSSSMPVLKCSGRRYRNSVCSFCDRLTDSAVVPRQWFDFAILFESPGFVAVPALGSIVPGYMMIVSRDHVTSMARLPAERFSELLEFSEMIANMQAGFWSRPVIFEHGAYDIAQPAGTSICHAHWHLVPGTWDLVRDLSAFRVLHSAEQLPSFVGQFPYLFLRSHHGGCYLFDGQNIPRQFFRRILAREAGVDDMWDYFRYPFLQNMENTIRTVKGGDHAGYLPTVQTWLGRSGVSGGQCDAD